MPAVSKAQFKKMYELHAQGKITDEQLRAFVASVNYHDLPDHSKPK